MEIAAKIIWGVAAVVGLGLYLRKYRHVAKDSNEEGTQAFSAIVGLCFGLFALGIVLIGLVYLFE